MKPFDLDAIPPSLTLFYKLLGTVDAAEGVEVATNLQETEKGLEIKFTIEDKPLISQI